jgi:hypothetical protein
MNTNGIIASLKALDHFTIDGLELKHYSSHLSGINYTGVSLRVVITNT